MGQQDELLQGPYKRIPRADVAEVCVQVYTWIFLLHPYMHTCIHMRLNGHTHHALSPPSQPLIGRFGRLKDSNVTFFLISTPSLFTEV